MTNNKALMRPKAIAPLKILAVMGAAMLMWGLFFAYASSPAQAATLTVNSLSDTTANDGQCTLREAIYNANANDRSGSTDCAAGSGSDVIDIRVTGTVNLTGALPNLSSDMSIEGPGADRFTVRRDTGGEYRIFVVTSDGIEPVVSISGITISGGNEPRSYGGGILNFGTLTVTGTTISGNSAHRGGGISNHETLTTTRSTISGNSADLGGGIYSSTVNLFSPLTKKTTITNSTISGNSSPRGGGVLNWSGLTVIEHSTITNNTAPSSTVIDVRGTGVASSADANTRTEVLSSIVSDNTHTDADYLGIPGLTPNTFDSNGYNLIGDGNATAAFNQGGDLTNVGDPKLGALSDNGGPTQTHALLAGSPARDAIPFGANGCGTTFAQDQRGVARPQGDACDIGAFELSTITVNSLEEVTDDDGKCTLREAITAANDNTVTGPTPGECAAGSDAGSDVIELGVTGTVNLTGALPELHSNLQIRGPGADRFTVRRDTADDYRIFTVTSGSVVSISGITISDGSVPASFGGGIFNDGGNLAITDSTISGNQGNRGGGVANRRGALTIKGSTISGNRAGDEGGGVSSTTSLSGPKTTIANSTISSNYATARGGGVSNNDGLTVVEHSTITNNTAPSGSGSGVASVGSELNRTEVLSSIVSGNTNTDADFTGVIGINSFVSKGYNLIGDGNATDAFGQSSDQANLGDPKLGALSNNDGPTETHALLAGSPAIDKGNTDLATDQRGKPRPFNDPDIVPAIGGDNSDIGSFEAHEVLDPAPEARDDAYSTDEDTTLTREASTGVLSNDTDNDPLTADVVDNVDHGTLTLDPDGSFDYTPDPDFSGPDSFTYKATDGTDDSNTATVSIVVTPVNDAPAATDDVRTMSESGAPITIDLASLVSDKETSDADLTYNVVSGPTTAQGTLSGTGSTRTFDPADDFGGSVEIIYTVTDRGDPDGCGTPDDDCDAPETSAQGKVTVNVVPVNVAPTLAVSGGSCLGDTGTSGRLNFTVGDVDSPLDSLVLSATSSDTTLIPDGNLVPGGNGTDSANRSLGLSAAPGKSGSANLTLSVSDGTDTTTLPMKVNVGTRASETITGTGGADVVFGLGGRDILEGRGGPDLICGGGGNDTVRGGGGNDVLDGGRGADRLNGGAGNDRLLGKAGTDTLTGGNGSDFFSGGAGVDVATDYTPDTDTRDSTTP